MASFTVTFDTAPESAEDVKAHYYQVEDGWFHFKDSSGEQVASYREGDVVSVERKTEERKAIHYGVVGAAVDAEALKRAIKAECDRAGVFK